MCKQKVLIHLLISISYRASIELVLFVGIGKTYWKHKICALQSVSEACQLHIFKWDKGHNHTVSGEECRFYTLGTNVKVALSAPSTCGVQETKLLTSQCVKRVFSPTNTIVITLQSRCMIENDKVVNYIFC